MKLVALPALTDNYIWMLHDGDQALVVDPGDADPVLRALETLQLSLAAILVTHRHHDHTLGLARLRAVNQGPVYGPRREAIDGVDTQVGEGDQLHAIGLNWRVWDVPGHTAGHVCYLAQPSAGTPWPGALVFCGDTLFSAGCGRLFDGTMPQLFDSLNRLATLPDDTWLCPTHEYTVSNLRFALAAEPGNADVTLALADAQALRARAEPTLPTTVAREKRINPYLRVHQPTVVRQALAQGAPDATPLSVFTTLRQWKNHYPA